MWPAGPLLIFIGSLAVRAWRRGRETSEAALRILRAMAVVSGSVVAYQALRHGWPVVSWLAAGGLVIGLASALRSRGPSLRYEVGTAVRNAAIAATAGVAVVVAMQVALAYQTEGQAERALRWNHQLAAALGWLERVVFLGPLKLGILLAASIAMVVIAAPALHLVRSYRRVARTATHALLALTVATSFTFFTGQHARDWQADWIARQRDEIGAQMDELDERNSEIVATLALDDAFRAASPVERTQFRMFVHTIDQHPHRDGLWRHVATRWKNNADLAPVVERVRRAQAELDASPTTVEARATADALDRLRRVRTAPEDVELADLEVLGIERSKAAAAHDEVRQGAHQIIAEIVLGDSLPGWLLKTLVDCAKATPIHVRRGLDVRAARAAMRTTADAPPRISFDLVGVPLTDPPRNAPPDSETTIKAKVVDVVRRIDAERAKQERQMREAEARLNRPSPVEHEKEQVPSITASPRFPRDAREILRPSYEHPMPARPSVPPARALPPTRYSGGRSGGSWFGGRRRAPGRPLPVRLVA